MKKGVYAFLKENTDGSLNINIEYSKIFRICKTVEETAKRENGKTAARDVNVGISLD